MGETAKSKRPPGSRIPLIDEIRGASILLMVLYHAGYDLVAIFGVDIPFFFSSQMNLMRDIMAGSFILISGLSCRLSHSNTRRGLMTFGFGMGMTLVTYMIIPDQIILFGVLHCLGVCMLLFSALRRVLDRINALAGAGACVILFNLTYSVPRGMIGGLAYRFALPRAWYEAGLFFPLGFPSPSFFSSDYYPLIPWAFLFLCGAYLGIPLAARRFPAAFYRSHAAPLAFAGRHTLLIYLLHQPLIYGAMTLFFKVL